MLRSLVGSEMCIRDRVSTQSTGLSTMTCPRWISVLLLALCLASANNSSCGGDRPSKVKDCDHTDLGSCGNSCCGIEIQLPDSPEEVYNVTTSFLKGGGDDGSYTYVTGKGPGGQDPGDDLRHFGICLLYTSDAADEEDSVDLGGRRIIKKKKKKERKRSTRNKQYERERKE
eukprot:TRINITY_DN1141_c0_g2_i3.p1 TRINITY_DN1141_c0_g2~~TRINITY_DN1141_c0_g2_i3.p1  ORF type:complete len:172 (+),score=47.08 TRINITY_DN1141_c0_g2_i3:114-629(+)